MIDSALNAPLQELLPGLASFVPRREEKRDGTSFQPTRRTSEEDSSSDINYLAQVDWIRANRIHVKSREGILACGTVRLGRRRQQFAGTLVNQDLYPDVLSLNPDTNRVELRKVTRHFKYITRDGIIKIDISRSNRFGHRQVISCTPGQLFLTPAGYRPAHSIKAGDSIVRWGRFLTDGQRQIVLGGFLGDSHFSGRKSGSFRIQFTHGEEQREYLEWKRSLLQGLFSARSSCSGSKRRGWHATTKVVHELYELLPTIFPNDQKVLTSAYVDLLGPLALAIFYLDDGCLEKSVTKRGVTYYVSLGTQDYLEPSQRVLAAWLMQVIGENVRIQHQGKYFYLRLNKQAAARFLDIVEPFIPACMAKKHRNPERATYDPTPEHYNEVGSVTVKAVTGPHERGRPIAVYNFDVAEHGNFITGNLVARSPKGPR
jgi:recombination protein RecA